MVELVVQLLGDSCVGGWFACFFWIMEGKKYKKHSPE